MQYLQWVPFNSSENAKVAQLVEHDLAKVGVASSNLVFRSLDAFAGGGMFPDFEGYYQSAGIKSFKED